MTTKQQKEDVSWKQRMFNGFDVGHELVTSGAGILTADELVQVKRKCERTLKYVDTLIKMRGETKK